MEDIHRQVGEHLPLEALGIALHRLQRQRRGLFTGQGGLRVLVNILAAVLVEIDPAFPVDRIIPRIILLRRLRRTGRRFRAAGQADHGQTCCESFGYP